MCEIERYRRNDIQTHRFVMFGNTTALRKEMFVRRLVRSVLFDHVRRKCVELTSHINYRLRKNVSSARRSTGIVLIWFASNSLRCNG